MEERAALAHKRAALGDISNQGALASVPLNKARVRPLRSPSALRATGRRVGRHT